MVLVLFMLLVVRSRTGTCSILTQVGLKSSLSRGFLLFCAFHVCKRTALLSDLLVSALRAMDHRAPYKGSGRPRSCTPCRRRGSIAVEGGVAEIVYHSTGRGGALKVNNNSDDFGANWLQKPCQILHSHCSTWPGLVPSVFCSQSVLTAGRVAFEDRRQIHCPSCIGREQTLNCRL